MKYARAARLTRRQDIERIRVEGRTLKASGFIARWSPSPFSWMRVGVVVPRYGHSAVDRNRLKRRLREIVRTTWLPVHAPVDVVIWAQASAYRLSFDAVRDASSALLERLRAGLRP